MPIIQIGRAGTGGSVKRRARVALVVMAVLLSTNACGWLTGLSKSESSRDRLLSEYTQQEIKWEPCPGDYAQFDCGTATVPLDYSKPGEKTVELALARLKAGGPEERIGSLLLNPGGPGGSGVNLAIGAALAETFPESVMARYDLVGFDPRGAGQSQPVQCLDGAAMDAWTALDLSPDTEEEKAKLFESAKRFAESCAANSDADLLAHVGTSDAARDMDVLRQALGDEKLYYYGHSYGTILGQYYAELFPQNVGRMVLDSNAPARAGAVDIFVEQAKGLDKSIQAMAGECATKLNPCPVGNDGTQAYSKLQDFIGALDTDPVPAEGRRRPLSQSDVQLTLAASAFDVSAREPFFQALAAAQAGQGAPMGELADEVAGRREDGRYKNIIGSGLAIGCTSMWKGPRDQAALQAAIDQTAAASPILGGVTTANEISPCAFWSAPVSGTTPHPVQPESVAPILLLHNLGDGATPYAWGQEVAQDMPGAVLLTNEGTGHGVMNEPSQCLHEAVAAYLTAGTLPPPDTTCTPEK